MSEIVEKLRATFPIATNRTVQTITAGIVSSTVAAPPFVYRNPDGPEAAALIEQQAREIARLREALKQISETPNAGWIIARAALEKSNVE